MDKKTYNILLVTGVAGFLAALLVGIGEFTLQFSPLGGYEAKGYGYFANVSKERLTIGHFFSTLAAPLYILGYWHLGQMFIKGGSKVHGCIITLLGGYAFMVGNAWLGGRIYLALTAHEITNTTDPDVALQLQHLLSEFGAHNEPLVNALRLAVLIVSILWIWRIAIGKTLYPRWVALFSPAVILGGIFATYFTGLSIGVWLLPAAMNVVHLIIFSISIYALHRTYKNFYKR
ncbi:DUF6796 family protein [Psychromonas sp. 14N.309.X.WAT.B.A12]|uniref:DUF6796 family protein n=2 Tax=Psychromonas TaxID=67572 RepID=UPI0025AF25E7|nr:DUF6796 family protein [Psychromonas sp. 14N.309.X.WAT.B.A12]MDN2663763.1 hypothetical protein [Psychromonas sp. 14N.309.X.WAT.B.A12]